MALWLSVCAARPAEGERLKVLTYNVWHGFWRTPARELLILPSESDRERRDRYRVQSEELERTAPDMVLAQEVHPLPWRAREIAERLGHRSVHQLVSCGLRFLNLGIPWQIRSGLVMTARPEFRLEALSAPVLSGRVGYCNDWLGLQLEETRRALLGRVRLADGRRLLVVTTHLHSSTLGGAARTERRLSEVEALLLAIERERSRDPTIAGVVLGGDLNAMSDSKPIERLRAAGFVDVVDRAGPSFWTYDPWSNPLAARMVEAGGGDPERSSPRRIDYLFVSPELDAGIRSVRRYGLRPDSPGDAMVDSDHFGVLVELDL